MDRVPWGLRLWPLTGYNQVTRVGFLAGLLSNEWLAEWHVDMLVAYLNNRLQRGNQPGATLSLTSTSGRCCRKSEVRPWPS